MRYCDFKLQTYKIEVENPVPTIKEQKIIEVYNRNIALKIILSSFLINNLYTTSCVEQNH